MGRRSRIGYRLSSSRSCGLKEEVVVWVQQDTGKADGLGGVVWPAAWALCRHLEEDLAPSSSASSSSSAPPPIKTTATTTSVTSTSSGGVVVELGAGAGLCGLVAGALGWPHVILTDEFIDLLHENAPLPQGQLPSPSTITVCPLEWGGTQPLPRPCQPCQLVLGCEITPMIGTHTALLTTLQQLCPPATAILTLDLCGPPTTTSTTTTITPPPPCGSPRCAAHRFLSSAQAMGFDYHIPRVFTSAQIEAIYQESAVVEDSSSSSSRCSAVVAGDQHDLPPPPRLTCSSDYIAMLYLTRRQQPVDSSKEDGVP